MERIFLGEILDFEYIYAESEEEKTEIADRIFKLIFDSKSGAKYKKYKKKYYFTILPNLLDDKQEWIDLFSPHTSIEYTVLKSRYKYLKPYEYIKVHINNLYGYLFDNDVYYPTEYYQMIARPYREYYKLVNMKQEYGNIDNADFEAVKNKLETALARAEVIKQETLNRKLDVSWIDYKKEIRKMLYKILNNYKTMEELGCDTKEWELTITRDGWSEDNMIVAYINRSITGYIRDYTNYDIKKLKRCRKNGQYQLFKLEGIKEKYHPLQLCVSKFYETEEDLLAINIEASLEKLTNKQKLFIEKLTYIIEDSNEKDLLLFKENGLPKLNERYVANIIGKDQKSINEMVSVMYKRVINQNPLIWSIHQYEEE